MHKIIERYFQIEARSTNIRTEVIAGITTFMAMAYIIFVNPAMISQTGMDFGSAMMATCISAAVSTLIMGLYANYPIALAAGMGENAFFTYTVCLGLGISWQVALGCVFIEGVIFILLTLTKFRQTLMDSIPVSLRYAIACGIGLFISFIGLIDSGLVIRHPATFVTLGDVLSLPCILAICGLIMTGIFLVKKIQGALLWGILTTTAIGIIMGLIKYQGIVSLPPSMSPTFLKMDLLGALSKGLLAIIFIFLFMDIFDTVGTLAGVAELGGFIKSGKFAGAGKAMLTDAIGTCIGAACGTPTVTSFIESAAGIASGGKTGLTSVITALLFFMTLFFSPLVRMIGGGYLLPDGTILHPVTGPSLIIIGSMMTHSITKIRWDDYTETIPAFLIMIMTPLTFSIATGIAVGFISYAALKLFTGRHREVSWLVYLMAIIFILRFIYLKSL